MIPYVLNYIYAHLNNIDKAVLKLSIMNEQFINIDGYSWNSYEAYRGDWCSTCKHVVCTIDVLEEWMDNQYVCWILNKNVAGLLKFVDLES